MNHQNQRRSLLKCKLCGVEVSSRNLPSHYRIFHMAVKSYPCSFSTCCSMFASIRNVQKHIIREHSLNRAKKTQIKLECSSCRQSSADLPAIDSIRDLYKHMNNKHLKSQEKVDCFFKKLLLFIK